MKLQRKHTIGVIVAALVIILGGLFWLFKNTSSQGKTSSVLAGKAATVYRAATCGCCKNYIAYLKKQGMQVKEEIVKDVKTVKEQYNIPSDVTSCHTTVMDKYVIEGHIPTEVIEKLATEQPDIAGIALPGMPQGSPGMPGAKTDAWQIYSLGTTESTIFTTY